MGFKKHFDKNNLKKSFHYLETNQNSLGNSCQQVLNMVSYPLILLRSRENLVNLEHA